MDNRLPFQHGQTREFALGLPILVTEASRLWLPRSSRFRFPTISADWNLICFFLSHWNLNGFLFFHCGLPRADNISKGRCGLRGQHRCCTKWLFSSSYFWYKARSNQTYNYLMIIHWNAVFLKCLHIHLGERKSIFVECSSFWENGHICWLENGSFCPWKACFKVGLREYLVLFI